MKNNLYIAATATELAEAVFRQDLNNEILFALCFERDELGRINDD
jgi:hypothetical protein